MHAIRVYCAIVEYLCGPFGISIDIGYDQVAMKKNYFEYYMHNAHMHRERAHW